MTLSTSPVALRRASSVLATHGIGVPSQMKPQERVSEEQGAFSTEEIPSEEKAALVAGEAAEDDIEIEQPFESPHL